MNRIEFKTLNNKSVIVNIAAGTKTFTPATQPLVISEDNDEDIFSPVRCKTGTVRILAEDINTLQSLIPAKPRDMDKLVTVYHQEAHEHSEGEQMLVFRGFVQPNAFSQEFVGHEHVVEIPISGMLDTMKGIELPYEYHITTGNPYLSLRDFIEMCFGMINGNFTVIDNVKCPAEMTLAMSTLFNIQNMLEKKDDEDKYDGKEYKAKTCYDAIESICKYFGVCCREIGENILFYYPEQKGTEIPAQTFASALRGNGDQQSYVAGKKAVIVESKVNKYDKDVFNIDFNSLDYVKYDKVLSKVYDGRDHTYLSYLYKSPKIEGLYYVNSLFLTSFVRSERSVYSASIERVVNISDDGDVLTTDLPEYEEWTGLHLPIYNSVYNQYGFCRLNGDIMTTPPGADNFLVLNVSEKTMTSYKDTISEGFDVDVPIYIKVGNKYLDYRFIPQYGGYYEAFWTESRPSNPLRLSLNRMDDNRLWSKGWINPLFQTYQYFRTPEYMIEQIYGLPTNAALFPLPSESITGALSIEMRSPRYNIAGHSVSLIIMNSFSVSLAKRFPIAAKLDKTADKNDNTYTKYLNAGSEEYNVSSNFATAVGVEQGKGIVLNADGSNYHDFKDGKCPEEYFLDRIAEFYNRSHSVLTISREYDVELDAFTPNKAVTIAGKQYAVTAVESDYHNNVQNLTLIEL